MRMSRSKRTSSPAGKGTTAKSASEAPLTKEQQAIGIALAGGSISTPLLLALLDKVLTLDEIQSVCNRAREIARNFEDLPEGRFALACLEDFLLARNQIGRDAGPALVPSDQQDPDQQDDPGPGVSDEADTRQGISGRPDGQKIGHEIGQDIDQGIDHEIGQDIDREIAAART